MTDPRVLALALLAAAAFASVSQGFAKDRPSASLEGSARIVDGDTLDIAGTHIRLVGMDAPERSQICRDEKSADYRCGNAAADALARLIGGAKVICRPEGLDRYRRTLAVCGTSRWPDLGLAMIRDGWATVYDGGPASAEYRSAEESARRRKIGLWRGPFERPSAWRRQHLAGGHAAHA